jgi:hypothetical protein
VVSVVKDQSAETSRGRYYVEALGRGLSVLDCFIADPGPHALVELSRSVGLAPEFTQAFRSLTPREFFRFSHELESTAKEGASKKTEKHK